MFKSRGSRIGLVLVIVAAITAITYAVMSSPDESRTQPSSKPSKPSKQTASLLETLKSAGLSSPDATFIASTSTDAKLNEKSVADYFDAQIDGYGNSPAKAAAGFIALTSTSPGLASFKETGAVNIDWIDATESPSPAQNMVEKLIALDVPLSDGAEIARSVGTNKLNPDIVTDYFTVQIESFENSPEVAIAGFTGLISGPAGRKTFQQKSPVLIDWVDAKKSASEN